MKLFEKIIKESEIEDFHLERMRKHIDGVRDAMDSFLESDLAEELGYVGDKAKKLHSLIDHHDRDKLKGELFEQYKYISWLYKCKLNNEPCDIEYTEDMDMATRKHIKSNPHHVEYWDDDYDPSDNKVAITDFNKRDSTVSQSRNGEKMDDDHIIEMCCDWRSTAHERGNTAKMWADKCRTDKRYVFTDDQWDLIYKVLSVID